MKDKYRRMSEMGALPLTLVFLAAIILTFGNCKNKGNQSDASAGGIIVCGDFNDSPISYTHRVVGEGLNDAFVESGNGFGISYNQNHFYFRIDNILLSKNLKSYRCTVDNTIKSSDHYPIWCYVAEK